MIWFTHFTRPARKGSPAGGRNHAREMTARTLCGIPLGRGLKNRVVILDPFTRARAYPDCKRCAAIARRRTADGAERRARVA